MALLRWTSFFRVLLPAKTKGRDGVNNSSLFGSQTFETFRTFSRRVVVPNRVSRAKGGEAGVTAHPTLKKIDDISTCDVTGKGRAEYLGGASGGSSPGSGTTLGT